MLITINLSLTQSHLRLLILLQMKNPILSNHFNLFKKKFTSDLLILFYFHHRRGSNNSLTLTINPNKKKLQINSPSKECSTIDYLNKQSRLLSSKELIEITKNNLNLYNEFYVINYIFY
jgi:hypothetical protein